VIVSTRFYGRGILLLFSQGAGIYQLHRVLIGFLCSLRYQS